MDVHSYHEGSSKITNAGVQNRKRHGSKIDYKMMIPVSICQSDTTDTRERSWALWIISDTNVS